MINLHPDIHSENAEFNIFVELAETKEQLATSSTTQLDVSFWIDIEQNTCLVIKVKSAGYEAVTKDVLFSENTTQNVRVDLKIQKQLEVSVKGYDAEDSLMLVVRDAFGKVLKKEQVDPEQMPELTLTDFETVLYYVQLGDAQDVSEHVEGTRRLRDGAKYLTTKQVLNAQDSGATESVNFQLVKAGSTGIRKISVTFDSETKALVERTAGSIVTLRDRDSNAVLDEVIVEAGKDIGFETAAAGYKVCFSDPVFKQLGAECVTESK